MANGPPNEQALAALAESQIGSEIAGELAPWEAERGIVGRRQSSALAGLGAMFAQLFPFAERSAQRVGESYKAARAAERAIWDSANKRLNDLKQNRAAEAQQLAQEMGGPVALGEFEAATSGATSAMPHEAAGSQLFALSEAEAGTQYAEAFPGRVLPVLRTELEVETRKRHEEEIARIDAQIASIKASKTGKVSERRMQLLQQEREFWLNKKQMALESLKANRDWKVAQRQLGQRAREINLAESQLTETKRSTLVDEKLRKMDMLQRSGESRRDYLERVRQFNTTTRATAETNKLELDLRRETLSTEKKKVAVANQQAAFSLAEAFSRPGEATTYKETQPFPVGTAKGDKDAAGKLLPAPDPSNPPIGYEGKAYYGTIGGRTGWWINQTVSKVVPAHAGITEPQGLYQALINNGVAPGLAKKVVRTRTGNPDWKPGTGTKGTDYNKMSVAQLKKAATGLGWSPKFEKNPTKPYLLRWIINHGG